MNRSFAQFSSAKATTPVAAWIACALALAACATLPPPTSELAAAQQAVSRANDADADQYAAAAIALARSELAQAQAAMASGTQRGRAQRRDRRVGGCRLRPRDAATPRATRAEFAQRPQRNRSICNNRLQLQADVPERSVARHPAPPARRGAPERMPRPRSSARGCRRWKPIRA